MNVPISNMNYFFNVAYFEGKNLREKNASSFDAENNAILNFDFKAAASKPQNAAFAQEDGFETFSLYTTYPGLLVGTGNPHDILQSDTAIKCGFTFDYVTGLPYLPGSSMKGVLRSAFPNSDQPKEEQPEHADFIRGLLGKDGLDVEAFKADIFEHNDVFLDAFPSLAKPQKLLAFDYITPHSADGFKNPVPIQILKIRPNVAFAFSFLLHDYLQDGEVYVTAAEKAALFKDLLLWIGAGAKTNVGFGHFASQPTPEPPAVPVPENTRGGFNNRPQGGGYNNNRPQNNSYNNNRPQGGGYQGNRPNGVQTKQKTGASICQTCGKEFQQSPGKPPSRFCSACKQAFWKKTHK